MVKRHCALFLAVLLICGMLGGCSQTDNTLSNEESSLSNNSSETESSDAPNNSTVSTDINESSTDEDDVDIYRYKVYSLANVLECLDFYVDKSGNVCGWIDPSGIVFGKEYNFLRVDIICPKCGKESEILPFFPKEETGKETVFIATDERCSNCSTHFSASIQCVRVNE